MKKSVLYFVILVLVLAFSGCNGVEHEPAEKIYGRNAFEHWVLDKNGEKLEVGAHELDEEKICAVCKSKITYFDEIFEVSDFDEHKNPVCTTAYNLDGTVNYEILFEYEYDEHGNILFEKSRPNPDYITEDLPMLTNKTVESEYAPDSDGVFYVIRRTTTYENGEYLYEEFIEGALPQAKFYYDENEILYYEEHFEYSASEGGSLYLHKTSSYDFESGNKVFYEFLPDGQLLSCEEYNEAGECYRKEIYEYNEENLVEHSCVYNYGELTNEFFYDFSENENGRYSFCAKRIIYNDDGTGIIQLYNENDELISEETF